MKKVSEIIKNKKIKTPEIVVEKETKTMIKNNIGVPPSFFKVSVQGLNIKITSYVPAIKNEIFLKKEKILKELENKTGKKNFKIFLK